MTHIIRGRSQEDGETVRLASVRHERRPHGCLALLRGYALPTAAFTPSKALDSRCTDRA
jgi:hypothetical protein